MAEELKREKETFLDLKSSVDYQHLGRNPIRYKL